MNGPRSRWTCLALIGIALGVPFVTRAQAAPPTGCAIPLKDPLVHVKIADHPFDPIPTRDGCWIFVSAQRMTGSSGVVVLHRTEGKISEARFVPTAEPPLGMALTHDEKLPIVTTGTHATFLDVPMLISGSGSPMLGSLTNDDFMGAIVVTVTADDHWAFVTQERSASITVIDLEKVRNNGITAAAIVGRIPTGQAPVGSTLSPDGRYLYATSETAPPRLGLAATCAPENPGRGNRRGGPAPNHAEGLLQVIDVAKAVTRPLESVVANVRAGCNTVRVAISPDGGTAYVTARGDNAVLVFDTMKLLSDPVAALRTKIPVGDSPVGIAVIDSGTKVVVTNSNRFGGAPNASQTLTVIDATKLAAGAKSVLGTIAAGAFPRQLTLTADGHTLLLTNFTSGTLEVIDVMRLPIKKR